MPEPEDAPTSADLADSETATEYVALMDATNYRNADGDHITAQRGEPIVNPHPGAVDRLLALGAIGSLDDLDATVAADRPMLASEARETELTAQEYAAQLRAEQVQVARMQASTGEQPADPSFGTAGQTIEEVGEGEALQTPGKAGTLQPGAPEGATGTGSPAAMTDTDAEDAVARGEGRPRARRK